MRHLRFTALGTTLMMTAGCLGGGSDGDDLDAFTAFSAIAPSSAVRIDGIGRVVQYDVDPGSGDVSVGFPEEVDVQVDWSVDGGGELDALKVQTNPANPFGGGFAGVSTGVEFDEADGDTITTPIGSDFIAAETTSSDQAAFFANPALQGYEYQTFGAWANGLDSNSGVFGVASVGSVTPASGVPTSDVVSYSGRATGAYVDATGTDFYTFANFDAEADFGAGADGLTVATTNTTAVNITTGIPSNNFSLNFSGTGDVGQPFSVGISNLGPTTLAGTLDGQFYGPNAEELGGTFVMTGIGGDYMGAVGAAAVP